MEKKHVYLIWAGGAAFALVLYLAGPDRLFTAIAYGWDSLIWSLRRGLGNISGPLYDLIRAFAIAIFIVFWVLGVMALRRGQPARAALAVLTLLFLFLVGLPSHWGNAISGGDWVTALVVAVIGALIMTGRVARGK